MLSLRHMTGPFAVRIDRCNLEVPKILYTALARCYFPGSMTATPAPYQQTVASVFSAQDQQRMDWCQSVPTGRDRLPISTASWMPCWRAFRLADGQHSNAAWSGGQSKARGRSLVVQQREITAVTQVRLETGVRPHPVSHQILAVQPLTYFETPLVINHPTRGAKTLCSLQIRNGRPTNNRQCCVTINKISTVLGFIPQS